MIHPSFSLISTGFLYGYALMVRYDPVRSRNSIMGFITDYAMSSWILPADGGQDSLSAVNAIGVDTFTVVSRPSFTSASCTLAMAGTSCPLRF